MKTASFGILINKIADMMLSVLK